MYVPSLLDPHPDHRAANHGVAAARLQADVLGYEVWSPAPVDGVLDVTGVYARKEEAMRCYAVALESADYLRAARGLAAYRGITVPTSRSAKSDPASATLVAVVAQAGTRKAVAQRAVGRWPQPEHAGPVCAPAKWQRLPMRATLQPTAGDPVTFDVVGATSLIEEGDNDDE